MDDSIVASMKLEGEQRRAACQEGYDTVVLAGAGCGKTATLVGRYVYLLASGLAPEEIVAITFTERAGQEMRTRIRGHLRAHLAANPPDRSAWLERYLALDAAPIGTIHSYCARLLRAHPAEAGLDPDVAVLDQNQAAVLASEAVERALAWAVREPQAAGCFPILGGPEGLRRLLHGMLARQREVEAALAASGPDVLARWREAQQEWLCDLLHGPDWEDALTRLAAVEPLVPGDALDECRRSALAAAGAARRSAAAGDWEGALRALGEGLRRPGNAGSRHNWGENAPQARSAVRAICDLHRDQIERVTARADAALDEALAAAWPGLAALFRQAVGEYEALKAQRQAVDYDDLEAEALRVLETCPEAAGYHRRRIKAVLVDEFQDTNDRQRRLVEALVGLAPGQAGRLFIVGDAKQSIYRFRGADVTVFRGVEEAVVRGGGRTFILDRTYRAHASLLEVLNPLLAAILGCDDDRARPYRVPFAPLSAARDRAPALRPPFVELHLGVADSAERARQAAATALAGRLWDLQREGVSWGAMACLFRATTHFPVYEQAFEQASIPYVTVAGTGFFDRPEVRDLLNALRALADPADDLAMAGLLRSPAMGLADASLYLLRWGPGGEVRPLWGALRGDLGALEPAEQARARRAAAILTEVAGQAGREPVAALLKRLVDLTAYRAILRLCPETARAVRNVDKLLADAHRSGAASAGEFLEYVQALRDTAAREGEAPPEAGEAVQLMSVHKAKGLEFDVVAIADAAHDDRARIPDVLLHPRWGLLLRVSRAEGSERWEGLAHGLARRQEEEMQDAEERRLIYVAATRAREKLLISGHAKPAKQGIALEGWIRRLASAIGDDALAASQAPGVGSRATISFWEGRISCTIYGPPEEEGEGAPAPATRAAQLPPAQALAVDRPARLARPYRPATIVRAPAGGDTPNRVWRVIPTRPRQRGPRWLVGKLVHLGLRQWRFEEAGLVADMATAARAAGLTDGGQIQATTREALRLLGRFHESDFFRRLDGALERRHEVPYVYPAGAQPWGRIDLLCRMPDGWWVVDLKTHHLLSPGALALAVRVYGRQLHRYAQAVRGLLAADTLLWLCFLDYCGAVEVRQVRGQEP